MSGLLERRVSSSATPAPFIYPSPWFPRRVKLNGFFVWRLERTINKTVLGYEWFIDPETLKPWEGTADQAEVRALMENDP